MARANLYLMYVAAILAMCVMYATQPIQPLFEKMLEISRFQASLFTTSFLAPLAVASIVYGYFLEKFSIKNVLFYAFLSFGILEILFALSSGYYLLIFIRGIQGLIAPAALTGIMSYIAQNSPSGEVGQNIGRYVGVTIIGGFIARFLSGLFTDIFGWRFFFLALGISLLMLAFAIQKISQDGSINSIKPTLHDAKEVFKIKHNFYICASIFFVFFSFQAILSFVPFYMMSLGENFSGSKTGMMYLGYVVGVLIAFNVKNIVKFFKNPFLVVLIGIVIFILSIFMFWSDNYIVLFTAMVVVCIGNFIAHSVASSTINARAKQYKAMTNGFYVSFYYTGGTLGSFAPSFIYQNGGWSAFLLLLTFMLLAAIIFMAILYFNDIKKEKTA
ncbi:MFS transporter [Campylobacter sp. RM13119]|nr:MFS transporter [Campylobacter sp. RM13119]